MTEKKDRSQLVVVALIIVMGISCIIVWGAPRFMQSNAPVPSPTHETLCPTSTGTRPIDLTATHPAALRTIVATSSPSPATSTGVPDLIPTALPLVDRTQLLPHDGLFIRRNNEYGRRLAPGVKDLIEQGVMIGQRDIKFDDFVPLSSKQVPVPQFGQSLAVGYGITQIPLSRKRDDRATHYLGIALRASETTPITYSRSQAPSVNYVFVVDTSGSMEGEKLDAAKISIRELFGELSDTDFIGIIDFDDRARTLLSATPVGAVNSHDIGQKIGSLNAAGGTDINQALRYGIIEAGYYATSSTVSHVFLFTDGNPTSGETDWLRIRRNIVKEIRDKGIHVSTFAFGSDANTRELDALAGVAGGTYSFVINPKDLQVSLEDELVRREHLAAVNIQMRIEIDRDIPIVYLYGHDQIEDPVARAAVLQDVEGAKAQAEAEFGVEPEPDIVTGNEGIRIFVPDLAVGETYWVIFEVALLKDRLKVGKATVQYVDTFARKNEKHEICLELDGQLPPGALVQHALGLWTSEVVFYALDDLYQEDLHTARERIEEHINLLESANADLSSEQLKDDVATLRKFLVLAENLGQVWIVYDEPTPGAQAVLFHTLNAFGRVRNGFDRADLASNP
jgi:Mg-chelatase subunit ChlD